MMEPCLQEFGTEKFADVKNGLLTQNMNKTCIYSFYSEKELRKIIENVWNSLDKERQDKILEELTIIRNLQILKMAIAKNG